MPAYEALVARLLQVNRFTAVKRGLGNMEALNSALGDPAGALRGVVHVAGSNGKGSVCWKVAAAARHAGLSTGLFVSPHVSCWRERVQVDGRLLSEDAMAGLLERVFAAAERAHVPATFFELTTATALLAFAEAGTDVTVLEAGLGGRLDSTNVVPRPAVTALTSVALEHTRILGDTREAIAADKAGIAKRGAPMVVGPTVPLAPVRAAMERVGAGELRVVDGDGEEGFDAENNRVAAAVLALLGDPPLRLDAAAAATRPPCRLERVVDRESGAVAVLDAGHNLAALRRMFASLSVEDSVRVVFGMCRDKDTAASVRLAAEAAGGPERVHLVEAPHPRAESAAALNEALGGRGRVAGSVAEGVRAALTAASAGSDVVVVTGSLFLMADARKELGIEEPVDTPELRALIGSAISASRPGGQGAR